MLTLVASALAGGDCIDDADALRAGSTNRALGCKVKAPFGHPSLPFLTGRYPCTFILASAYRSWGPSNATLLPVNLNGGGTRVFPEFRKCKR